MTNPQAFGQRAAAWELSNKFETELDLYDQHQHIPEFVLAHERIMKERLRREDLQRYAEFKDLSFPEIIARLQANKIAETKRLEEEQKKHDEDNRRNAPLYKAYCTIEKTVDIPLRLLHLPFIYRLYQKKIDLFIENIFIFAELKDHFPRAQYGGTGFHFGILANQMLETDHVQKTGLVGLFKENKTELAEPEQKIAFCRNVMPPLKDFIVDHQKRIRKLR